MSENTSQAVEVIATTVGSKATYAGGTATLVGWAASVDWLAVTGVLIALAGFALNAYFQIKKNRREDLESRMRMQREQEIHDFNMKQMEVKANVKQD
ncbi:holin [Acinetobacter baumannii]|uniref:holin n=1 Tax=Acinetobacter baumannii TaxID=470 RepID=UPI0025A2E822|nr:holin [Acinetobacter baumannii]